ncbi:SAM-dependent methyltransferase [Mycobacterium sp. E2462]|uniref:SAM-dependent methyltransferase n=1 Tax=Mycobacterium sp. E2462 TaxID=1834133 RepID=UPI0008002696|nr:SAM-dependent methyltransferase [Mycobacterium sp. E2462]OBI19042.1 SAM-dependent methyltransferase [Mycobacterium sp. E2462]
MAAVAAVGVPATFAAAVRAAATSKGTLNDPYAEALVRAAGIEYFTRLIEDEVFAADDGVATPGLAAALAAHTRFVDGYLADAGRAGIRQVVLLAPGLDTRAFRLWWPPGTTVYEVDRPEVLDFKSVVLQGLQAQLTAHRRGIGIDLNADWPEALRRVGFDAALPTVWVAEQLFVGYLTPEVQDRVLTHLTAASAPGSRLAADHLPVWSPLQLEAERDFVDGWRRRGLDVDLASLTHPGEYRYVPDYLTDRGWATVKRRVDEVCAAVGAATPRRDRAGHPALIPEYVTAEVTA